MENSITTTVNKVIYASFAKRSLAFLIDFLIIFIPIIFLTYFFSIDKYNKEWFGVLINLAEIWIFGIYYSLMESSKHQATLGKKVLGLKTIDINGKKINFEKAFQRFLLLFLSFAMAGIGIIMMFFSEKNQTLHDKFSGTLVVNKDSI